MVLEATPDTANNGYPASPAPLLPAHEPLAPFIRHMSEPPARPAVAGVERKSGRGALVAIPIVLLLLMGGVGAYAYYTGLLPGLGKPRGPAEVAADTKREPVATTRESATAAVAPTASEAAPVVPPDPSAPASASASPVVASPDEGKELPWYQGYLTVQSSASADVVVQGVASGRTNERLLVRCGPRNVRLREGTSWLTDGEHVQITCMQHTVVAFEPKR
jgi:hypothetical protein